MIATRTLRTRAPAATGRRIVTRHDHDRLRRLIVTERSTPGAPLREVFVLEEALDRAAIVEPARVPGDVVTMRSTVRLRDLDDGELESFTLAYPEDRDLRGLRLSVLTPLGSALLGARVGDVVSARYGLSRVEVQDVLYQPERARELDR
jgi:regulator of nucleoside diphosphate kinase